jgi:hypothetical protein
MLAQTFDAIDYLTAVLREAEVDEAVMGAEAYAEDYEISPALLDECLSLYVTARLEAMHRENQERRGSKLAWLLDDMADNQRQAISGIPAF